MFLQTSDSTAKDKIPILLALILNIALSISSYCNIWKLFHVCFVFVMLSTGDKLTFLSSLWLLFDTVLIIIYCHLIFIVTLNLL